MLGVALLYIYCSYQVIRYHREREGGREGGGREVVTLTERVSVTIRAAVGEGCQGLTGSEPRRERARATEGDSKQVRTLD